MTVATKGERILPRLIEEEIKDAFLDYSMSVIVQRALPDVRDGLKPVHRRILFAMHELALRPDRAHKKCATVVGEVLGKYHPHGDSAVYDALVRMVQDFSLRYPLVDGQGNFGSIDGDSAAAYRYTEARLAAPAMELLADIEKNTVKWEANFDDRLEEPTVLPGLIPNLLVNGSSGIAVGMSTNVPPHNLSEVAGAVRELIANPECTTDDLMQHLPGPDFPTGGYIIGTEGIRKMYETGRGRVVMRAKVATEQMRNGKRRLVVTEIPYATSKSKIISQIADLSRKGSIPEVSDMRDESDREGLRLVVELKRGSDPNAVMATLFRRTYLQTTFGAILLALDHGEQPVEFKLKEILERYRDHRLAVIRQRSAFDLEKAQADLHITQGLILALTNIDDVVEIIKSSMNRGEAKDRLQDTYGFTEIQADAILDMRLARLTGLEREKLEARQAELVALVAELRALLKDHDLQLALLLQELEEVVEKFGDERRTEILDSEEMDFSSVERTTADENVVVTYTHQGYVKRIPMSLYRRRVNSGKALAGMDRYEDDYLEKAFMARSLGWLLAFTSRGQAHFLKVEDIPEGGRNSRGKPLVGLLGCGTSDPIVATVPVDDLADEKLLVFVTRGGIMKRTNLSEFSNPRAGGVIATGVKQGDTVLDVVLSDGTSELMLLTRGGRAIRFPEGQLSVMGRTAKGVKGIGLRSGDEVVGLLLLSRNSTVLTMTNKGLGKRTPATDFPVQNRGGLGTKAIASADGEDVVSALDVRDGDSLMVVAASGAVTQIGADSVSIQGRNTRGKPLIKLAPGDHIVELTRAYASDDKASNGSNGAKKNGSHPPEEVEAASTESSAGGEYASGEVVPPAEESGTGNDPVSGESTTSSENEADEEEGGDSSTDGSQFNLL